ncbi:MAG: hypothetical protein KatS3mg087_1407 [Patescibacteria group bacterium]|nr:MAG: hypothetical protein KatS3mg087_1407 [Patescibacteria group bacterium]
MHITINAGPGSGKTYTITHIPRFLRASNKEAFFKNTKWTNQQRAIWKCVARHIPISPEDPILYAAYNNDLVKDAQNKVIKEGPFACECRTIHGAGYKVINKKYGYCRINSNRGIQIVERITGESISQLKNRYEWLSTLKYLEKCKDELRKPTFENFEELRDKYDSLSNFRIHKDMEEQASLLLPEMKKVNRKEGIEYIDQVWLAIFLAKEPIYKLGLIDEAQDLSPSRFLLAQRLCEHVVWVGDPDQAINAFAGADPHAFDKVEELADIILPLKVSFRCPPNIVQRANTIMAQRIIPRDSFPLTTTKKEDGEEKSLVFEREFPRHIARTLPKCMVICRYNAPLFRCAFHLMKQGINVAMLGKQLVNQLTWLVKKQKAGSAADLEEKIQSWVINSSKNVKPHIAEMLQDKADCILYAAKDCETVDEVVDRIEELFKPKKGKCVTLSTIHKAKGREAENVYILFPPVRSQHATTTPQKQQEQNLEYVAVTRTKKNLYWVHE